MSSYHIKLDLPEALNASDSITASVNRIQAVSEKLPGLIAMTDSFWNGDAAEDVRAMGSSCMEAVGRAAERLRERAEALRNALMVYEEAERENNSRSADLTGGLIS